MTVKATFIADFSSFTAAVEKAEAKLVDFEQDAGKVGKALDRMVDKFNGRKLIQEAILMSKAVEEAGGTARLTASQLEQVGNKANEAADKLRLMGKDVPAGLQKIVSEVKNLSAATKPVPGLFDSMLKSLGPLGTAAAGAFSVTALIGFGKQVLDTANDLVKMSDRTGIGVVALQRLDAIAQSSGNSIEDIANAVNKFQRGIAEGKLNEPIERIGLSVQKLREQSPDEQFIAIAKAIQQIKDPAEQTRAAMELFGRSGGELLPSLKADVDSLANSTVQMSAESVKALDDLGDAMGRLKTSTLNTVGEIIGRFLTLPQAIRDAQTALDKFHASGRSGGPAPAISQQSVLSTLENEQPGGSAAVAMDDFQKSVAAATDAIPKLSSALKPLGLTIIDMDAATMHANQSLGTLQEQLKKAEAAEALAKALDAVNKKIAEATAPISELTDAQKVAAKSYRELGLSVQDIGIKLGVTATSVKAFQATVDLQKAALIATTKAFKDYLVVIPQVGSQSQAIDNILQGLTYDGLLPASDTVEKFNKHLLDFKDIGHAASGTMAEFRKEVEKADAASKTFSESFLGIIENLPKTLESAFTGGGGMRGAFEAIGTQIGSLIATSLIKQIKAAVGKEGTGLTGATLAQAGATGAAAGVGTLAAGGSTGQAVAAVGATSISVAALATTTAGMVALGAATFGVGLAAVGAYAAIKHFLSDSEKKINPLREEFVQAHGGLEALNVAAHAAGVTLDRMLDAKNPKEYNAAILELNKALDHQAALLEGAGAFGLNTDQLKQAAEGARQVFEFMRDSGKYAASQIEAAFVAMEEAAAAAGDTAAQAWLAARNASTTGVAAVSAALDELQKKRDGLSASIANEAPEAVMGVTEAAIRAQIADVDRALEAQRAAAAVDPVVVPVVLQLPQPGDLETPPDIIVPTVIDMPGWKHELTVASDAAVTEFGAAADGMTAALKTVRVPTIHVPVVFDVPPLPEPTRTETRAGHDTLAALQASVPAARTLDAVDLPAITVPVGVDQKDWSHALQTASAEALSAFTATAARIATVLGDIAPPSVRVPVEWDLREASVRDLATDVPTLPVMTQIDHVGWLRELDQAKTDAIDAFTTAADGMTDALAKVSVPTVHVPVVFDYPTVERPEAIPMASGGMGRVTRPTLFLAGEAGPEDYAFSGGGSRFAARPSSRATSPPAVQGDEVSGDIVLMVDGDVLGRISRKSVMKGGAALGEFRRMVRIAG